MGKLIYVTNLSLDGFIDDEVFAFTTDIVRSVGTFLYGRCLYESVAVWEADPSLAARSDLMADFASAWQATGKVVYSTALTAVSTADTRLESRFDPAAVRELNARAGSDLMIGGAGLGAQAFEAGLVDERRFRNGVLHLRYRPVGR
ncbi:dihydrofolate reductase family protein [Actinomadura kijaniata]|uniref:dihydrofolate reductase family protein n=1 Tax=Actinomadura kijaniata TaxID=46161 RepID=UPI003F1B7495